MSQQPEGASADIPSYNDVKELMDQVVVFRKMVPSILYVDNLHTEMTIKALTSTSSSADPSNTNIDTNIKPLKVSAVKEEFDEDVSETEECKLLIEILNMEKKGSFGKKLREILNVQQ